MKKLVILVVALVSLIAFVACDMNYPPDSSKEEALYVVQTQPDFHHLVQYFSVLARGANGASVRFYQTEPSLRFNPNEYNEYIGHVVIYQTNNNTFCLLVLSSSRPTKVIARREIVYQYQVQESQK